MSDIVKVGQWAKGSAYVFGDSFEDGIAGLSVDLDDIDFIVEIVKITDASGGLIDPDDVSFEIIEISGGDYRLRMIPDDIGTWKVKLHVPAFDWYQEFEFQVTEDGLYSISDIRIYLDGNSTKLAHLDADISTRATPADLSPLLTSSDFMTAAAALDTDILSRASQASLDATEDKVEDIQARIPDALVGGSIKSFLIGVDVGAITASALDAGAMAAIADAIWSPGRTDVDGKAPIDAMKVIPAIPGKSTGDPAGTPITLYGFDPDVPRVVATVDASGNRTAVSYP